MPESSHKDVAMTTAKAFLDHINRFKSTFFCPSCGKQEWGIQVMSVDPSLVDNQGDSEPDLDLVMPRYVPGISIPKVFDPPLLQALPAICQSCGYVALFDATIVSAKEGNDE